MASTRPCVQSYGMDTMTEVKIEIWMEAGNALQPSTCKKSICKNRPYPGRPPWSHTPGRRSIPSDGPPGKWLRVYIGATEPSIDNFFFEGQSLKRESSERCRAYVLVRPWPRRPPGPWPCAPSSPPPCRPPPAKYAVIEVGGTQTIVEEGRYVFGWWLGGKEEGCGVGVGSGERVEGDE